jgi:hypothetical protein
VEDNKAFIDALFICEKLGIRDIITFCIDTGANSTCLFEREAVRLGIDLDELKGMGYRVGGVGGSVEARLLENIKLGFYVGEHRMAVMPFNEVTILIQPRDVIRRMLDFLLAFLLRLRSKSKSEVQRGLPNLLGFDFLKHCKISFSDEEAYLDID